MRIGSYGYVNLDFMTKRRHDDIFTEACSYATFSPSIYDMELMFFHTHIHRSVRNIVYIMFVTNWWSEGVVKYEYVMTMGCAAQESILAKSITVLAEQYPVCHQQRDSGTLRCHPGICMDCLLFRVVVALGMLHPTPFVGDAGVHRKVVVQIERSFETITPGARRIVYDACGTVSTCQQKKI